MTPLLTETQAAETLGLEPATLRRWRWAGYDNLPYLKIGRSVRYDPDDIAAFIESARHGDKAKVA
jgi:hypothetical protein